LREFGEKPAAARTPGLFEKGILFDEKSQSRWGIHANHGNRLRIKRAGLATTLRSPAEVASAKTHNSTLPRRFSLYPIFRCKGAAKQRAIAEDIESGWLKRPYP